MLNTHKLIYLFPEVTYIAELLPSKKPSTFTLQSFRQVNGEYIVDGKFIGQNILKLFKKLDQDDYHLVLPDFLFTNTIANVTEATDTKIKQYLKEKLLPSLDLSQDSFQIDTTILTEHGNETKVQISALENSLLEPVQISAQETNIAITAISPLSWTLKSLISLEPSISVTQMDSQLFTAFHYIGVDQTAEFAVDEVESVIESIKALKGAEPSIQTVYLLSNELVESKLKDQLSEVLPIQQLASDDDSNAQIPPYIRGTIEAGMRTLSIDDYPVPEFDLGKAPVGAKIAVTTPEPITEEETDLPKPNGIASSATTEKKETDSEEEENKEGENEKESPLEPEPNEPPAVTPVPPAVPPVPPAVPSVPPAPTTTPDVVSTKTAEEEQSEDDEIEELLASLKNEEPETESQKTPSAPITQPKPESATTNSAPQMTPTNNSQPKPKPAKKIIRNKNRTRTMLKMVFVTLAVFFATVGVGIGIGLGVLQLTQPSESTPETPVVAVSPSPVPSPSPSPSPSPELNKEDLSVLVVNATTTPGYAGDNADQLESAGFGTVEAGNARGDYEPGMYVLMAEQDQTLISTLEEATDLELTYQEGVETEDPNENYDAVIVLAE